MGRWTRGGFCLAVDIASALGKAHRQGIVHKDVKPANVLVNCADGGARLTGFGIASRMPRERQAPEPPEIIAGTLAYMAPEQTGRMNRSIDSRSDLYALGVTFYEMLTGRLPFKAADPMEWVHCQIARKPTPPAERSPSIPALLSDIVMRLLAKPAEERYQTAAGLERDLRRSLDQWERLGRIEPFPLGERDVPDRLVISEKLYGREREVEALLAAFDRVVCGGPTELVLVSGYSGIGKSSVVNELQKALVPPRGLFASGKFDQLKRDVPYAPLAQALQGLIRLLLGRSDSELALWRRAFLEALEPNARLITDLIPELSLIIGEQPPVPELEPKQARSRFHLAFSRFIGVFARAEHPLALFLDDLQWLDAATLGLMEDLLTRSDLRHLMLIGAYRDNEVDATHPLTRKLEAMKNAGGKIEAITLAPLTLEHLRELVSDTLRCESESSTPLAQLAHEKTAGNPFFVIQFLHALADEGALYFDHAAARWSWDLDRIHAMCYTDNVVDLMVGKLTRLPVETQQALQQLACLGADAAIPMLSIVLRTTEEQVHVALWPAVRHELVERLEGRYKFIHDRVQEAAYSLTPVASRAEVHLRIGRLLVAQTAPEERDEAIFEIVNQLNRGVALITEREEREQLAELNLIAGKRAKGSTAYASALAYLNAGAALLADDSWKRRRELAFALELNRAESEFLTGALDAADRRLAMLWDLAANAVDRAAVTCLRVDLFTALGEYDRAFAAGLEYLHTVGIDWSAHPTQEQVRDEYQRIWLLLGNRTIVDLIDLPLMTDPQSLATLDVLGRLMPGALFGDPNLFPLITCGTITFSIEHGNGPGTSMAYETFAMAAGPHFGNYDAGFQAGRLGHELVEKYGFTRFQPAVYLCFGGHVMPFMRHVLAGRDLVRRALESANGIGDLTFVAYSYSDLNTNLLAAGDSLVEVQREVERGLAFAQKARVAMIIEVITAHLGLVRTLRGLTRKFGSFDDDQIDEREIEHRFFTKLGTTLGACRYWGRKLQARFFAGDYAAALDASAKSGGLQWRSELNLEVVEYHFYSALTHAACLDSGGSGERQGHVDALVAHHRQLEIWAEHCPENFENRVALVGAEIARFEGRVLEAEQLYEQATRSARASGFVHQEALAYELASRFYLARGFEDFARLYLSNARGCYRRWGADGKVRQLDDMYPHLRAEEPPPSLSVTIEAPVDRLDLATVIKVSQAASSEIVFEKLINTIMRTALEQSGAEKGVLALAEGAELKIAAEATTAGDQILVHLRDAPLTADTLPESLLVYAQRTRESVILDDAAAPWPFAADPYFHERRVRSALCLPLINQAKLIGVLFVENNLAPQVFSPSRIAVLKLLASQAAISLENSRLYRDLAEREGRIRQFIDANIVGIFIWRRLEAPTPEDSDSIFLDVNDEFPRIVGYERDELLSGRIRIGDLTPPEWRDRTDQGIAELKTVRAFQPYEKEYIRKDGSLVPVLIGAAAFEEKDGKEGLAFVLDLTDRKRAEAEARENERRYREMEVQLARANRLESLGQLTASIAHEVNQPIAATMTNAQAGLRWLRLDPPDLEEVRHAFERIVQDAARAGAVVQSIRNLVKKTPPRDDRVDITAVVHEVIDFTRSEAMRNGVSIHAELAEGLPPVRGDRVELQQVALNLILNAIEAMSGLSEGRRELRIAASLAEARVILVAVHDSGPGLGPAIQENLFKAFHTTKPNGLGLGLSICRSIVESHGGRLWASANAPRGAVFQFTLPCDQDDASLRVAVTQACET